MSISETVETRAGAATMSEQVRDIAAAGVSAALAGLLVGGVGGRVVMRISALLNPARVGVRTDNGNRVGDLTASGTIELILFGGLLTGAVAAIAWVAIRTWLPKQPHWRYPAAAVSAVGLVGFLVIVGDNIDFFILDPPWAHVGMFVALVAVAGALTAWIDHRLSARWRGQERYTLVCAAVVSLGALLTIPAVGLYFTAEFCNCESPPRTVGVFVVTALAMTGLDAYRRWRGSPDTRSMRLLGAGATIAAVALGLAYLGEQISAIV